MPRFIRQSRHTLLVNDETDLGSGRNIRQASPFLHAACCLNGFKGLQNAPADILSVHRLVYENARSMLGEIMVASPLPLEEITGILIFALYSASPSVSFHSDPSGWTSHEGETYEMSGWSRVHRQLASEWPLRPTSHVDHQLLGNISQSKRGYSNNLGSTVYSSVDRHMSGSSAVRHGDPANASLFR